MGPEPELSVFLDSEEGAALEIEMGSVPEFEEGSTSDFGEGSVLELESDRGDNGIRVKARGRTPEEERIAQTRPRNPRSPVV